MQKCTPDIDYAGAGLPEYDDFKIAVYYDELAETPRAYENFGTLVCFGKNKSLGHEADFDRPDEAVRYFRENDCLVLPVYMYSHGGSTISTAPFSDRFDSGQIGYIYATPDDIVKRFGADTDANRKEAKELLKDEIKELDMYVTGDVYRFKIEKDGNEIGFAFSSEGNLYGMDYCVQEALSAYRQSVQFWKDPETAMKHLQEDNHFFEEMPDAEKTPALAEVYLKSGGDVEFVPDNVREEMGLELKFQDGTTMSL